MQAGRTCLWSSSARSCSTRASACCSPRACRARCSSSSSACRCCSSRAPRLSAASSPSLSRRLSSSSLASLAFTILIFSWKGWSSVCASLQAFCTQSCEQRACMQVQAAFMPFVCTLARVLSALCVHACKQRVCSPCARLKAACVQFVCKQLISILHAICMQTCKQFACSLRTSSRASFQAACGQLTLSLCASALHGNWCASWLAACLEAVCILHARLHAAGGGGRGGGFDPGAHLGGAALALGGVQAALQRRHLLEQRPALALAPPQRLLLQQQSSLRAAQLAVGAPPPCRSHTEGCKPQMGLVGRARVGSDRFTGVCVGCVGVSPVLLGCTGGGSNFTGLYGDSILYFVMFF